MAEQKPGPSESKDVDSVTKAVEDMNVKGQPDLSDLSDLPTTLIVTDLDERVFTTDVLKKEFESLFQRYDDSAKFYYLKSFRRARVDVKDGIVSTRCRLHLHETMLGQKKIKVFFAQPLNLPASPPNLEPPKPQKQFLISPPASPPVGWEPVTEAQPIVSYDILAAIAHLAPGQSHELHPPSTVTPSVVVHVSEDPTGYQGKPAQIPQTKRPDYDS